LHVLWTNNYFSGGAVHHNSGKTFGLVHKSLKLSWLNRPLRGGIVAPSIPEYKKDVLPVFEAILEENRLTRLFHYHKTDKVWTTPWKSKIEVATAEKRIRGPNWAWACINEGTLISEDRWKEVVGRVRVKGARHPQIASSGTPEGKAHYVYEKFVDQPLKNSRIIFGDTRANARNLDPSYIPTMESAYDPTMLQAYMMGLFVNLKGNLFYYSYDTVRNHDKAYRPDPDGDFLVSLDFNVDPMCATIWQYTGKVIHADGGNGILVPFKQLAGVDQIELGPQAAVGHASLTDAMCAALKARGYTPDITTIYPDPAGKARSTSGNPDIVILKRSGYDKIKYRNAAPQFRKRQLCVNNLLAKGIVVINPDKCPGMRRDWEAVEQDPTDFSKIKDNPKLTHHSDGFDYLADIEYPLSGAKPDSTPMRIR
jgi:hypothetical protein